MAITRGSQSSPKTQPKEDQTRVNANKKTSPKIQSSDSNKNQKLNNIRTQKTTQPNSNTESIISNLESNLRSFQSRLEAVEKQEHHCKYSIDIENRLIIIENFMRITSTESHTDERITAIEAIIDKQITKKQLANCIYNYVDNEINERLSTIDQTLESFTNIEISFSSYRSHLIRIDELEQKMQKLRESVDSCDCLMST